jgi:hypothetical protein
MVLVPEEVVTVTSTAPADPAGLMAVIDVGETTLKEEAGAVPNVTAVAPDRFVPVTVIGVPPVVGPLAGLMDVTVGAPGGVTF